MIKRRYYDFRQGNIVLAPVIGLSNFMMLAYLTIAEMIPIWLFIPIFIGSLLVGLTFVGAKFRKIQFSTDLDLGFERARSQGETFYQIMKAIHDISPQDEAYVKRMKYMKNISEGKI